MGHGLSITLIYPILGYMVRKGYNLESFYQFASFDKRMLTKAEGRIQEEEFDRLLDAASAFMSDEQFGLHLGQLIELSSLGILGYVLLNCESIEDALAAYRRYNVILCSGIHIEWETAHENTNIFFIVDDPARQASRHAIEGIVSSLYNILLKLSCRNIALKKVQFAHDDPGDGMEYKNFFGINPGFGSDTNLICLESEALQYPIMLSNRELLSTFETYAKEARNQLLHGRTFADQVYKWILRRMPSTFPSVQDAAQNFNVSVRMLQVSLKQEKTTYNTLFNKARMEFAIQYLKSPHFTIGEIAYLLQFSEPSAFQSAFKRWTGLPPGQFRENVRCRQRGDL